MSNRIVITIPTVNVPEVEYVFHCLMTEFLGLQYDIVVSDVVCDFSITCNSKSLNITNVFFRDDKLDQLCSVSNIPPHVSLIEVECEETIFPQVTIFGKPNLTIKEEGYIWENDIVAASFYMLTRWEEKVILDRDDHNRFPAKESLAYKYQFLNRPIVNEYVEIIYQILKSFGLDQERKNRQYTTVATHDVDRPYLWSSGLGKAKSMAASLLIRRDKEEIKLRARNISAGTDPFDTFDRLMDMSESIGEKAHFFFMAGGDTEFDNYYQLAEEVVINLIKKIKDRNHLIGIHPSYNTYSDSKMLLSEIDTLKDSIGTEVISSRQHYLRFDVSNTWNILEQSTVKWDSTLCYADAAGFRSGICYSYPVYDLNERKQLALLEKPLIVMDTTLLMYEKLETEQALNRVEKLQNEVNRYKGEFVFLWHNSSFNSQEWLEYGEVYKSMYRQFEDPLN